MIIGLIGDTHADYSFVAFALWKMHREGITECIQVGDFGIGQTSYNMRFLKRTSKLAEHYGITIRVVPGNHEDWVYINEHFDDQGYDDWATLRPNILLAPRGLRWTWDGVSFVALGGAPSIDRTWRINDQKNVSNRAFHSWFPEEMITPDDVAKVVAGGYADVMVTHDAPKNVRTIDNRIAGNPHGFDTAGLLYAANGRELMDQAFRGVAPKTLIHGHYHFPVNEMVPRPQLDDGNIQTMEIKFTHILGLACNYDYRQHALGHYDTAKREGHMWDTSVDLQTYMREGGNFA